MTSTLLAYLWGTPKGESKVQGHRVTVSDTFETTFRDVDAPAPGAPTRRLPTELWIQILENVPRGTLAQVMLVRRSLCEVAEGILYHSVILKWNTFEVVKFCDSIATCARRGSLVTHISILRIDGMHERVPLVLPKLLIALPNLRSVKLKSFVANTVRCDRVFSVCLPHLRSFTANMKIGSDNAFFDFLAAHEELKELDLRFSYPPDLPAIQDRLDTKPFSSLRILACSSRFLNSRRPVLSSLTHLYRTSYLASEVAHIAALLGPQLVSLRLGGRFAVGADRAEPRWSLDDVATKFPRLRLLQVDSAHRERPYLDTSVVDWLRPRKAARAPLDVPSAPKLTVLWWYEGGFWSAATWAGTYDEFLDDAALKCLKEWGGYVERVVYEHSIKPYRESLTLETSLADWDGEEERLVKVQDPEIGDDYWKCV